MSDIELEKNQKRLSQIYYETQKQRRRLLPFIRLGVNQSPYPKSKTWEEHIKAIEAMDELMDYHQKVPSEIVVEIPTDKPIAVIFSADWHLGMHGVDTKQFKRDVQAIEKTDGAHLIIGGDTTQNIIQPGKMGSSHNQAPIAIQKGLYVLTLKKLLSKIIAIGTGNHNYWTALAEGEDWDGELAKRLNLVYTKHGGKIYLKVGKMIYPIFRMHKGKFNSSFNLTHVCKQYQRLYFPDARIVVIEHQHVSAVEQYRYNEQECVAIRPGTYAVYDDFALQNGFYGSHVANPTVILYPDQDKIVPFKDMYDSFTYLEAVRRGE